MNLTTRIDKLESKTTTPEDSGPMVSVWRQDGEHFVNQESGERLKQAELQHRQDVCIIRPGGKVSE